MQIVTAAVTSETLLERAIIDLLELRREIYPSHIVSELRRCNPGLPLARTRDVLERLVSERRVARLWHRYLLARDVEVVRAKWMAMINRQAKMRRADYAGLAVSHNARDLLMRWDGWRVEG